MAKKQNKKKNVKLSNQELVWIAVFAFVSVYLFFEALISGKLWAILIFIAVVCGIGIYLFWYIKRKKKNKVYKSNTTLTQIDKMTGSEFEEYIGELFEQDGYKVKVTQASKDYGADVILQKDEKTIAVQVKRYNNHVGISAVQEIVSAKREYKADEAWVITNNEAFTQAAIHLAKKNDVKLIARDQLHKLMLRIYAQNKKEIINT